MNIAIIDPVRHKVTSAPVLGYSFTAAVFLRATRPIIRVGAVRFAALAKADAITLSIAKWQFLLDLVLAYPQVDITDIGSDNCALCQYANTELFGCARCPIYQKTRKPGCLETPFYQFAENPSEQLAQDMIDLLKSLDTP